MASKLAASQSFSGPRLPAEQISSSNPNRTGVAGYSPGYAVGPAPASIFLPARPPSS